MKISSFPLVPSVLAFVQPGRVGISGVADLARQSLEGNEVARGVARSALNQISHRHPSDDLRWNADKARARSFEYEFKLAAIIAPKITPAEIVEAMRREAAKDEDKRDIGMLKNGTTTLLARFPTELIPLITTDEPLIRHFALSAHVGKKEQDPVTVERYWRGQASLIRESLRGEGSLEQRRLDALHELCYYAKAGIVKAREALQRIADNPREHQIMRQKARWHLDQIKR